jgi:hypothetical protein
MMRVRSAFLDGGVLTLRVEDTQTAMTLERR